MELPLDTASIMNDWSPDDRFVLYHARDPQTDRNLWVLPLEGDRKPWVFLKTNFAEAAGQFSPDGRWVAYQSNESGRWAAPIKVTGTSLEPGTPVALFQTRILGGGTDNGVGRQYDVTRDGRFLINMVLEDAAAPITLLKNWKPPAQKLANVLFVQRFSGMTMNLLCSDVREVCDGAA